MLILNCVVGLSASSIEAALRALHDQLVCEVCNKHLDQRIERILKEWALVKVRLAGDHKTFYLMD